jgi:hypothetical protein
MMKTCDIVSLLKESHDHGIAKEYVHIEELQPDTKKTYWRPHLGYSK